VACSLVFGFLVGLWAAGLLARPSGGGCLLVACPLPFPPPRLSSLAVVVGGGAVFGSGSGFFLVFGVAFSLFTRYNIDIELSLEVFVVLSSVFPSPSSVSAPVPGSVASLAASAGASFLCVRPSVRSFSRWVCVCLFGSAAAAAAFAGSACSAFGFPFCAVRSLGSGFGVSVPCFVSSFSSPAGSLPCLWCSFGGGGGSGPCSPVPLPCSSFCSPCGCVGGWFGFCCWVFGFPFSCLWCCCCGSGGSCVGFPWCCGFVGLCAGCGLPRSWAFPFGGGVLCCFRSLGSWSGCVCRSVFGLCAFCCGSWGCLGVLPCFPLSPWFVPVVVVFPLFFGVFCGFLVFSRVCSWPWGSVCCLAPVGGFCSRWLGFVLCWWWLVGFFPRPRAVVFVLVLLFSPLGGSCSLEN
jgi:hypothetical protein